METCLRDFQRYQLACLHAATRPTRTRVPKTKQKNKTLKSNKQNYSQTYTKRDGHDRLESTLVPSPCTTPNKTQREGSLRPENIAMMHSSVVHAVVHHRHPVFQHQASASASYQPQLPHDKRRESETETSETEMSTIAQTKHGKALPSFYFTRLSRQTTHTHTHTHEHVADKDAHGWGVE